MTEIEGRPGVDDLVKTDPAVVPESEVPAAVREALREPVPVAQIQLAPCPCGVTNVNLLIDLPQGSKVGRAGCSACGVWGVDFLAPRTQDQELVGKHAAKAWNEAPRAGHYEAP